MSRDQRRAHSFCKECNLFYAVLKRTIDTRSETYRTKGTNERIQRFVAGKPSWPVIYPP